tara:strand:- start:1052 stop:1801 length:750 start_codon:yes stop_codon:yes gene_type:complete
MSIGLGIGLGSGSAALNRVAFSSPSDVNNLNLWLDNGVGLTLDTSVSPNPVEQWNDSSGNNNHIVQSTDERATVLDGGLNFEEANNNHYDLTTGIDIGNNNAFTVFVVLKLESFDATQNTLLGVSGSANDRFLEIQSTTQIRYRQTGAAAVLRFSTAHFATGTKMLLTIIKDTNRNLIVRKNGSVLTQSGSTGVPVASGNFTTNQFGGRSIEPDRDFDGVIYEFLLYGKECSASELNNIETHLISEHGL